MKPKTIPRWTREKPKINDWQSTVGDRKQAVMALIDQGQVLRPGTHDSWSLDTFGASEYYGPLSPAE